MSVLPFHSAVQKLVKLGEPDSYDLESWIDYSTIGINSSHVPELIQLVRQPSAPASAPHSPEQWATTHAWRALGELRAEAAIAPLIELLGRPKDQWDSDGGYEELPTAFALIGPAAIAPLTIFLADESHEERAR